MIVRGRKIKQRNLELKPSTLKADFSFRDAVRKWPFQVLFAQNDR